MSYYVLTDNTARGIKNILNSQNSHSTRVQRYNAVAAYKDNYPHPYEVRWTESLISGGGYMIWLPNDCLNVAGSNVPLSTAFTNMTMSAIRQITSDSQGTNWYELGIYGDTSTFPEEGASLSAFSVWLTWSYGRELFKITSLSTGYLPPQSYDVEVELQTGTTDIKIADVKNYTPIPNVKSNIIINNNFKPFDLVELKGWHSSDASINVKAITRCDFMNNGKPIHLQTGATLAQQHSTKQVVRLVQSLGGDETSSFALDMADYANRYAYTMQKPLGIVEDLSSPITRTYGEFIGEGDDIKQFWPLYLLGRKEDLLVDYRDALYILQQGDNKADEKSVALTGDILSTSLSTLSSEYHLHHFHDDLHDYEISAMIEGGGDASTGPIRWAFDNLDMVIRQRNAATEQTQAFNELYYLDLRSLLDKLGGPSGGSFNPTETSAIVVDEQSVSKGGDGWQLSTESGVLPSLHMWHFHDSDAEVSNPEMCDIVLRYNPDRDDPDKWLRYISYEDLKSKLSSDIASGGGGTPIAPSQLSAVPSQGMFAWTESTRTMGPGGCMFGRQWVSATGTGSGKGDGLYQLKCSISNSGVYTTCTVVVESILGKAPDTQYCWIPIYQISGGKIAADYRGAFVVPCYE